MMENVEKVANPVYQTYRLAKNARERMDNLYYRAKPVDQLAVSVPIYFKSVRLVFK
jgi:hypothetical protein